MRAPYLYTDPNDPAGTEPGTTTDPNDTTDDPGRTDTDTIPKKKAE